MGFGSFMSNYQNVYDVFFHPGEVAEIRALGCAGKHRSWGGVFCYGAGGGVVSGCFNNGADFMQCAMGLDEAEPKGVYFALNPLHSAVFARAANRLKPNPKATTKDDQVLCLRWLYVDFDPVRPAGISDISSAEPEKDAALEVAKKVVKFLEEDAGFAKAIRADSGNGYHLLYRIPDLPVTDENVELLRNILKVLSQLYSSDVVDVDEKNFNPARICKLYGTMARKGDHTDDRPHRRSRLFNSQPELLADVGVTPLELLQKVAAMVQVDKPSEPVQNDAANGIAKPEIVQNSGSGESKKPSSTKDLGKLDVSAYLSHYGVKVVEVKTDAKYGTKFFMEHCVFNSDHRGRDAFMFQRTDGTLGYHCSHNTCKGRMWREAKQSISGNDNLARFCENYDPNWRPAYQRDDSNIRTHQIENQVAVSDNPLPSPAPPPNEVDPLEFFKESNRGGLTFIPLYMANYLDRLFGPIVHTDGAFLKYDQGVWSEFPKSSIESAATRAMGDRTQPNLVDNGVKTLARLVNKEDWQWEDCRGYVNCLNGMIDLDKLSSGDMDCLVAHNPDFGSRVQVPCNYNPDTLFDRWARFLREVFPGDRRESYEKQNLLQQFFGYCFMSDCRYSKALFLYGTGANGKSTAMNVLEYIVGKENTATLAIGDLGQRFNTQFLQNKLVNLATETNTRDPLSTEIFKAAVAGDPIKAEKKYGEPYQFRPFAKFVVAMNDTPVIPDKSFGFERRLLIIDFPRRFEESEMDPELIDKLQLERDGIFFWAMCGLQELMSNKGFVLNDHAKSEKAKFMRGLYPLLNFVDEVLEFGHFEKEGGSLLYCVHTPKVYEAYKKWCEEGGNRKLSRNKFYDQLLINFPHVKRDQLGEKRLQYFTGVKIRDAAFADALS